MSALASFQKNAREEVRVSLDNFNGYDLVNIRVWYRREDGEMRPGKQGLAIRLEQLSELQAALSTVERAAGRESEPA